MNDQSMSAASTTNDPVGLGRREFLRGAGLAAVAVPIAGVLSESPSAAAGSHPSGARGAAIGSNLLVNPGFEDGLTGWTVEGPGVSVVTDVVRSGNASLLVAPAGAQVRVEQAVEVVPGASYTYSSWHLKAGEGSGEIWLFLDNGERLRLCLAQFSAGGESAWEQSTYTFTVPPDLGEPRFLIRWLLWGSAQPVYSDDFALVATRAPNQPAAVVVAASGATARLAIENAGTNSGTFALLDEYPRYFGDSLGDMSRIFGTATPAYPPSGPAVADAADYAAAKEAVRRDPSGNAFYSMEMLTNDTANLAAPSARFRWSANRVREMRWLGAEPLLVVGPWWGVDQGSYDRMWEHWRRLYAYAYLMAKNYGVTQFNVMNEPNSTMASDLDLYLLLLREESDAVRAGVAAAGLEARIWAPTPAGGGSAELIDAVAERANDVIDVYDWHQYTNDPDAVLARIEEYRERIARFNNGAPKPMAMSEYSYALALHLKVDDFDAMTNVFNNMVITVTQVKNGLAAPIHFMFPRMNRGQANLQPPGVFTVGLVSVDDTSFRMTRATKMYYAYRMMYRALKAPTELVDVEVIGLEPGRETLVTRSANSCHVLLLNRWVDARETVNVDLSALRVPDGLASVRRVSNDHDDEFIGHVPVHGGKIVLSAPRYRLPAQSMTLLTVPLRPGRKPSAPVVSRAFATEAGNELWWRNQPDADTFIVRRREAGKSRWRTVGSDLQDAFFTDASAEAGRDYFYQVLAEAGGEAGDPCAAVGPLRRPPSGSDVLPIRADFEPGDGTRWETVSGTWTRILDQEDRGVRTDAGSGQTSLLTVAGPHDWGRQYMALTRFKVDRLGGKGVMGVVAQYADADNHYRFEYNEGWGSARIVKVAGGVEKTLAAKWLKPCAEKCDRPNTSNYRRYIVGVVNGTKLTMFLTAGDIAWWEPLMSAVDTDPLPPGKVGLVAGNDVDVFFDGLSVRAYLYEDLMAGLSRWSVSGGEWQIVSDVEPWLTQKVPTSGWATAAVGSRAWQDLELTAQVKLQPDPGPEAAAALFIRYRDADNHYRVELTGDNRLTAVRRVGGAESVLAVADLAGAAGPTHTVNVWVDHNRHRVWVDGFLVAEYASYEPRLDNGGIAVGARGATAAFRKIAVNTVLTREGNP